MNTIDKAREVSKRLHLGVSIANDRNIDKDFTVIAKEAADTIDALLGHIEDLEWENKGIAEWRDEYIKMRGRRDALIAELATIKAQQPVAWYDEKLGAFDEKAFDQLKPLYLAAGAQDAQQEPEGPLVEGWQLTMSDGHAGYGVYAHITEYPDEGAIFLLAAGAQPAPKQEPSYRSVPHGHCTHPKCKELFQEYLVLSEKIAKYEPEGKSPMILNAVPKQEPVAYLVYAKGSHKYMTLTFDTDKVPEIYKGGDVVALCAAGAQAKQVLENLDELSVGDSLFESWFSEYRPAHKGTKQQMRDAYAAGMGDPLVTYAQTAPKQEFIQPGYQLVPVEPTDKMVQASLHLDLSYMPLQEGYDRAAVYKAMLAAAPVQAQERKPSSSAEAAWIARKRETFPKDYEEYRFANWAENGRWEFINGWNACVKAYGIKEQS